MPALSHSLHGLPTCPCWQGLYGRPVPPTSPKAGFPLLVSGFFYGFASKVESFTENMTDIANRNFIYKQKLTIVLSVSSTLPKDGLPAPSERVFLPVSRRPKKKPAIDADAGFPVFSLQLIGVDFVSESCR